MDGPGPSPRTDTAALVALLQARPGKWAEYAALLEEERDAEALLHQEHGLLALERLAAAAATINEWLRAGIQPLSLFDPEYPPNLRAVHDRPPLIFVRGRLAGQDSRGVAVIGSRRASAAGVATARRISEHLVDRNYTVISGLARGIDTAAHTAALEQHARTLGVIGTGVDRYYPPDNALLQDRVAAHGAVISQFWPGTGPAQGNFPLRNAVMSGLALATVIVEASAKSGARTQARLALAHGRPVLLLKTLLDQAWARELARRSGVHVIAAADVAQVVEHLSSPEIRVG